MANFFKDYHAEVKAKREGEQKAKNENKRIFSTGEVVYINPMYDENRNGKRFFVEDLGKGMILLAKTKKEALGGYGYIYSVCDIVK